MKPVCYLDLDGVLVDFVGGAFELHGKSIPPDQVRYDCWEQMDLTEAEFFAPMGREFWANLKWTDEGPWLFRELEKIFHEEIVLVTAPCKTDGCRDGKTDWVRKHLPKYEDSLNICRAKHKLAAPSKLLVDDRQGNTDKFIARCGKAVLVPRPWNRLLGETDDKGRFDVRKVIEEVKRLLR